MLVQHQVLMACIASRNCWDVAQVQRCADEVLARWLFAVLQPFKM